MGQDQMPTSVWVPIETVIPHPDNPNRMTPETFAKLMANVGDRDYPPIIVRSLEQSDRYQEEHQAGLLQIIDGEHRLKMCQERGDKMVEVRIWRGVSDKRATAALLTMNRLQGKDMKGKRAELIAELYEQDGDAEALSAILPETEKQIQQLIEELERGDIADAEAIAAGISGNETITIFATADQAEVIRRAIKTAMDEMDETDETHQYTECEEGAALKLVCVKYLEE